MTSGQSKNGTTLYEFEPNNTMYKLTVDLLESIGFQIQLLLHAAFIRRSLHFPSHIYRCLWRRHIYCRQPSHLRPLVWSDKAIHPFRHLEMDFRRVHHTLLGLSGVSMDASIAGNEEWERCRKLLRSTSRQSSEYSDG